MAKKTESTLTDTLKGHINKYGIEAFSDSLEGLGWYLNLRVHSKIKVLAASDVVEFKPANAWEGPAFNPAGQAVYTVKRNQRGKIKVTHANRRTQEHGPYGTGKTVIIMGNSMYLPS